MGLVFLVVMPESPRFLISQKEFVKAREVFEWIGRVNGLSDDVITERMLNIEFEGESLPKSMRGPNLRFKKNGAKTECTSNPNDHEDLIIPVPEERKHY